MNIIRKLTLRHLREHMGRTVITAMGIIVSVAMITAVFVSCASFLKFDGDVSLLTWGNAQARYENVTQEQLEKLRQDESVSRVGSYVYAQGMNAFRLIQRESDRVGTGNIYAGDAVNLSQMLTSIEGKIPENDGEIAVEKELIEENQLDWKVGDTVEIPVGMRVDEDGFDYGTSYGWRSSEQFIEKETKTFLITGILDENPSTTRYKIVRGLSQEEAGGPVSAMVTLKKADHNALKTIQRLTQDYQLELSGTNSGFLESVFALDQDSAIVTSLLPMAGVVLAVIMAASVLLIYNAFGMSLSERVRYLGMLASVGATRKQKRGSVYFEGMLLGAIGILVGILSGIAGIYITLKLVGKMMVSTGMVTGVSNSGRGIPTVVPLWAVIGIVLLSGVTIFISAYIPARKASRITPIDAIRQTQEIRVKRKRLRSPRYVRWMFGYEGELAYKSLKRNGGKSRMITISITMSIVLFLSVNYFTTAFRQANQDAYEKPYQLVASVSYKDKDRLMQELEEIEGVDDAYGTDSAYYEYSGEASENAPNQELMSEENLTSAYKKLNSQQIGIYVVGIEDEDFRALCQENGIEEEDFFTEAIRGILMNNISHREGGAGVFTKEVLGEKVEYKDSTKASVEIGALVDYDKDNHLCSLGSKNTLTVFVPESTFYRLYPDQGDVSQLTRNICIETKDHESVRERIQKILDGGNYENSYVTDMMEQFQSMNSIIFVLEVFTYGFVVLITLIALANIVNTISTGILLRKKEFAMLKSVGMTPAGFRKMICLESVLYGLRALLYGLPLSAALGLAMNLALGSDTMPYEIDWKLYLLVTVTVFLLIGITMFYAVRKTQKSSIVEILKEEIN